MKKTLVVLSALALLACCFTGCASTKSHAKDCCQEKTSCCDEKKDCCEEKTEKKEMKDCCKEEKDCCETDQHKADSLADCCN